MQTGRFLGRCLPLTAAVVLALSGVARAGEPNANALSYATQSDPETLELDARQASRGLMVSHMTIPVRPGAFTFVYPKWIPGEHGPTGPLANISELRVSANGTPLQYRRDQVDM